jgi:hypothetical protein
MVSTVSPKAKLPEAPEVGGVFHRMAVHDRVMMQRGNVRRPAASAAFGLATTFFGVPLGAKGTFRPEKFYLGAYSL